MKTKRSILLAGIGAAGLLGSACGASPGDVADANGTCKMVGCSQGVRIDFSFRDAGAYVVEVTFEGVTATCRATLPLPKPPLASCDEPDVHLDGSGFAGEPESIEGLILSTTTAQSITVRATRDGQPIGEKTFVPPYVITPGPNGPTCAPKECKLATVTFP